jgi:hypothetical protein
VAPRWGYGLFPFSLLGAGRDRPLLGHEMIHEPGDDGKCKGCAAKLQEAYPKMAEWFWNEVLPKYPNAHVAWSYRGEKFQEECVKAGASKLHFPHSAHNRRVAIDPSKPFDPANESDPNSKPESFALDLFEINDGKAVWDPKFYVDLANDIQEKNLPIFWGGMWKGLGDRDHFQLDLK